MAEKLRVRPGERHVLRHPDTGVLTVPHPDDRYDADDALVKAFRWAFVTDEEVAAQREADKRIIAVNVIDGSVETAEAAPGQVTRRTRRPSA